MLKRLIIQCMAILTLSLAGCGGMASPSKYRFQDSAPTIAPDAEHGVVCFLWEKSIIGASTSYYIYEDDKKIGVIRNGGYFYFKTSPGKHTYKAEALQPAYVTVSVEPNTTAHVVFTPTFGGLVLTEINESVARNMMAKGLKYVTYTP